MPYRSIVPARRLYPYMPGAPFFEQPSAVPTPRPSRPSEEPLQSPRAEFPARAVPLSSGHIRRPPIRGREKEVKAKIPALLSVARGGVGAVTEALEVLDVLYRALPSSAKPRYAGTRFAAKNPSPAEKARAVFNNWSKLDASSALLGYLQNQLEDVIIGRTARGVRRNQQALDPMRPVGWLAGPAL